MPRMDAAPARFAAPNLHADSARRISLQQPPVLPDDQNRSELFAALFASTRLARQQRDEAAERQRATASDEPGDRRLQSDEARAETAESLLEKKTQSKPTRHERLMDSAHARASQSPSEPQASGSSAENATSEPHNSSQETSDGQPQPLVGGSVTSAPASTPSATVGSPASAGESQPAGGLFPPVTLAPMNLAVGGPASPIAAGQAVQAASVAPSSPGDAAANPSGQIVTPQTGALAVPLAGSSSDAGTQTAGDHTAPRQNAVGNAAEAGESAKAAPPGGNFDHLFQAAARTRGQLAARTAAQGTWRGAPELLRPSEPQSVTDLARVVRSVGRDGQSKMVLRLDPPELGQLRIDVRMQEQMLTLRMETHTQAGHDALQSRLGELKNALEQQGVQVQHMEVEHRPPLAPPSPQEQAWNQHDRQQHEGAASGQHQEQRPGSHSPGSHGGQAGGRVTPESTVDEPSASGASPGSALRLNLVA